MISHFFIDRPIFATVLSLVILIVGGVALLQLPIAQYPEVAPPTVQVTATYPGANAKTVADTVATHGSSRTSAGGHGWLGVRFQDHPKAEASDVIIHIEMLEAFTSRLRDEVDMEELREHFLGVVGETMQPAHMSLWLRSLEPAR